MPRCSMPSCDGVMPLGSQRVCSQPGCDTHVHHACCAEWFLSAANVTHSMAAYGCARAASKQSRGSLLRRPAKRVIHSWRVHRASEPAPPCPRSGRLTTAGAADRKTPSNRSRGAAARPPNIGRTHSEHTNQYWPIWPILANTLFPRRGGVKHITKGPNLCAQVPCIPPMDALAGQVLCIQ